MQTKDRFNSALGCSLKMLHLHQDKAYEFILDEYRILTYCIQSLLRFLEQSYENQIIVIDEPMSVLKILVYN